MSNWAEYNPFHSTVNDMVKVVRVRVSGTVRDAMRGSREKKDKIAPSASAQRLMANTATFDDFKDNC